MEAWERMSADRRRRLSADIVIIITIVVVKHVSNLLRNAPGARAGFAQMIACITTTARSVTAGQVTGVALHE